MSTISSLVVALTVRTDEFEKSLRSVEKSLERTAKQISSVGTSLTEGLTAPIVGLGTAASVMGVQFNDAFEKMVGLAGVSADQIGGLREQVLQLAGQTAKGPTELAGALYSIESAGLRGSTAMEALKASAMASTAGLGETKEIATVVASAVNAYGAANLSAAQATAALVKSAKEMKNGATELIPNISTLIPLAAQLRIPIQDLGGALAVMTRTGMDAAGASSALNRIMGMMFRPTTQMREALGEVGLTSEELRSRIGEDGLAGVLKLLAERFQGHDDAMTRAFPSMRSMSGLFALLKGDSAATAETFGSLAKVTGQDLNDAFNAVARGPGFQFRQLAAELQVALIQLSDTVLPVVVPMVERMAAQIEGLSEAFSKLSPGARDLIVVLGASAAAIGPALLAFAQLHSGVSAVASAIRLLVSGIMVTGLPAIATFVGVAVLIGTAAILIAGKWQELKDGLAVIFDWLMDKVRAVFGPVIDIIEQFASHLSGLVAYLAPIKDALGAGLSAIGGAAKSAAGSFKDELVGAFGNVLASAKNMASGIVTSFRTSVEGAKAATANVATEMAKQQAALQTHLTAWQQFSKKLDQTMDAMGDSVKTTFNELKKQLNDATEAMQRTMNQMAAQTAQGIGAMAASFAKGKENLGQFVQEMIVEIGKLIAKIMLLRALTGVGLGGPFAQGFIGGMFADGGRPPMGQVSIVGEKGPEFFVPDTAGTIVPLDKSGALGGQQITINQPITIQGLDLSSSQAAKAVIRGLKDEMKNASADAVTLALRTQNLADQHSERAA